MTQNQARQLIDLHLHTDKSDGTNSPDELVALAAEQNIRTIAITDHDTIDGLEDGIRAGHERNIKVIPGIEISAKYSRGTLHVLGYGIDFSSTQFCNELQRFQSIRKNRNVKIMEKLNELGIDINIRDMMRDNPGIKSLGRPHIAAVLIERGIVGSMDEAFDEYLGKQGRAFVGKEVFTSGETIRLIHDAGGVAFLAHPSTLNLSGSRFNEYIQKLLSEGLDGIEVYSSAHDHHQICHYQNTAETFNLMVSAGSDFHGSHKKSVQIGTCNNGHRVHADMVSNQLLTMAVA